jgi:hypothetical protein
MLDNTQAVITLASGAVLILSALIAAWVRKVGPWLKEQAWKRQAKDDFLVGRPPAINRITGEATPALPSAAEQFGAISKEVRSLSQQMGPLTQAVAQIAESHKRLDDHEGRIKTLEEQAVERVVTKAESAAAWRAMEAIAHDPDFIEDEGRGTE